LDEEEIRLTEDEVKKLEVEKLRLREEVDKAVYSKYRQKDREC